jgi:SRSO17 transposase
VVIRRCLDDPGEIAYYLVVAPPGTSLHTIVLAIGARWWIEVDLENAKDLGLDHYEVRSYIGWYRHMTLVMLASALYITLRTSPLDKGLEQGYTCSIKRLND